MNIFSNFVCWEGPEQWWVGNNELFKHPPHGFQMPLSSKKKLGLHKEISYFRFGEENIRWFWNMLLCQKAEKYSESDGTHRIQLEISPTSYFEHQNKLW